MIAFYELNDELIDFVTVWKKNDSYGLFNAYDITTTKRTSLDIFKGEIDVLWRM